MYAIRQYEFGPAENLRYERVPDPVPAEGQVRVAVGASGVHFVDTTIRQGGHAGAFPLPALPMTPGREVAGTVDAVGPDVSERWVARRVVAHLGLANGGYAQLAVANESALHEIPDHLTDAVAVAMIGTGRTALAVLDLAALTPGDVVLVTAAAGGLGSLFVQAARHAGCVTVGAAGGPQKVGRLPALGADVAVDYLRDGWTDQVRDGLGGRSAGPVTAVLDGVGGAVGRAAMDLLDAGGRLVLFGWSSGEPTPLDATDIVGRGLTVTSALGPRIFRAPGGLRALETRALAAAAEGRLVPLVGPPFPLSDAAAAHRALENRATVGKVVLAP